MYNANIPNNIELPSSKQLIKSTIIALITALILLVAVILPAEYGFDPTGAGKILGLTTMGEIKKQLASEAEQESQQTVVKTSQSVVKEGMLVKEVMLPKVVDLVANSKVEAAYEVDAVIKPEIAKTISSETRSVELKTGEAAEIKLVMKKGAIVTYHWSVDSGHVNYDTHGDNPSTNYFGYNKGKASIEDSGDLQAAFDGKHGWFWRNRSKQTVLVTLVVSGEYSDIQRVL